MYRRYFLIIMMLFIGLSATRCSFKAPVISITGEKTALQREVIGTYEQLEEDTWMIASTRGDEKEEEVKISPEKRKVLEALQQQKFNKDDVDEFKRKGFVGENNSGFVEIRNEQGLQNDLENHKLVQDIVMEENQDREVIMDRVIELNASLKKSVKADVLSIFAKMNQENSLKGTWIQSSSGIWKKK